MTLVIRCVVKEETQKNAQQDLTCYYPFISEENELGRDDS